jgi:hypothetical protein
MIMKARDRADNGDGGDASDDGGKKTIVLFSSAIAIGRSDGSGKARVIACINRGSDADVGKAAGACMTVARSCDRWSWSVGSREGVRGLMVRSGWSDEV